MNKKTVFGLIFVSVSAVALVAFVYYAMQSDGDRGFIIRLEPDEITLRVGEYRNLTINIVSTGYEGDVTVSEPAYTWAGEEDTQNSLDYQVIPGIDEPNARFIETNGELTLTLQIRWMGSLGTLYLKIAAYGNYQKENQFKVDSSNSAKITITLPS